MRERWVGTIESFQTENYYFVGEIAEEKLEFRYERVVAVFLACFFVSRGVRWFMEVVSSARVCELRFSVSREVYIVGVRGLLYSFSKAVGP